MIDNEDEYRRMFEVEQKLWWYDRLHRMVISRIQKNFKSKNLDILDAACGTGGLLDKLLSQGYQQASGFDASPFAVKFSRKRGLNVENGDLKNVDAFKPGTSYDVICCNDALYFLSDSEIVTALKAFRKRLNANGIILINIHAFRVFEGTHDVAVGSNRRFTLSDFKGYTENAGLAITRNTYWPFLLSAPILAMRTWQRYRLRKGAYQTTVPTSDVKYPGDLINGTLNALMRIEETLIPSAPFGSSLFMEMRISD